MSDKTEEQTAGCTEDSEENIVSNYQQSLDNEKVDCDCPACITMIVHEALAQSDNLENISFSRNFLKSFEKYFLDISIVETLSLFCGEYIELSFYDFHNGRHNKISLPEMMGFRLKQIYDRFEMEPPKKSEVNSFSKYILEDDREKYWCKSSMFRKCISREIRYSFIQRMDANDSTVIDFFDNFKMAANPKLKATDVLDACFGDYAYFLELWITESLTSLWFRNLKYASIENSEFVFKTKLEWLHRRIPEWSTDVKGDRKVCLIRPTSIMENTV